VSTERRRIRTSIVRPHSPLAGRLSAPAASMTEVSWAHGKWEAKNASHFSMRLTAATSRYVSLPLRSTNRFTVTKHLVGQKGGTLKTQVSTVLLLFGLLGVTAAHATATATPSISPAAGSYVMPQNVTITDSTSWASIKWCYVTTGTCTPSTTYSDPIYMDPASTETICANATASGYTQSSTACNSYTSRTATPVISLASGTYVMPQSTTISDGTSGATILWCYVTTGTCTPSTTYSGSINIDPAATETICANATASGFTQSSTACNSYTTETATATPVISLTSGTYVMPQSTTISDGTSGATILWCYVTTGTCTPSTAYSGSINIDPAATETICANATASGYTQSATACNSYTAQTTVATPAISLASGTYVMPQTITISDGTSGASIFWCSSASGACTPSTAYSSSLQINAAPSVTVCAYATDSGFTQSATTCNSYVASGDSRTVTEPTFPTGCTVISATRYSVWTNAVNIDPYNATAGSANGGTGTQGTLGATGGSDFQPSSSSSSYVSSETYDNTSGADVVTALDNSPSNNCVELVPGSAGESAFVMTPFTIPANTTLLVDAGVTVYMSRNPSTYNNGGTCGTLISGSGINGSNCLAAITMDNGSALMGYGRIDYRGWAQFTSNASCVNSGASSGSMCGFYYNTIAAFVNSHSSTTSNQYGIPQASSYDSGDGGFSSPPESINIPSGSSNVVLYKITLQNMPGFGIQWSGANSGTACATSGLTLWGIKIVDPFDTDNTDGFDPINGVCNFTVKDVYISNGDDDSAIKSKVSGYPTKNGSFININKYSGLGLSIGSATGGGISNITYNGVFCSGPTVNGAGTTLSTSRDSCIKVKSPDDETDAATISDVTYNDLYVQYEGNGIWVYPYYSCPGTAPTFTNFLFQNVTLGTMPGSMSFQSWSASNQATMTFNNFTATGSFNGPNTPGCSASWSGDAYGTFTVGPNPVNSTLQSQLTAGTGSTVSGTACTSGCAAAYSASPQPLVGELLMETSSATNQQCYTATPCTFSGSSYSITLEATLQAGPEYDTMEAPQLSAAGCPACTITFMDSFNGGTPTAVGTATLGGNGVTAVLPLTVTAAGTHVYSATYSGDGYYSSYTWGAVTVVLSGN
jgi:hypothetical protein